MFINEQKLYNIIKETIASVISQERRKVDKNPSEKQKEAGNYRKGHIRLFGLPIAIECPKGTYRQGIDKNGKKWKQLMHNDYGYFNTTLGKDGDSVDVFLGNNFNSEKVFVVDQYNGREFDESKVMLGFNTIGEAKKAYLSNYERGWKCLKYITGVKLDIFKEWLTRGRRQRIPFRKYKLTRDNITDRGN